DPFLVFLSSLGFHPFHEDPFRAFLSSLGLHPSDDGLFFRLFNPFWVFIHSMNAPSHVFPSSLVLLPFHERLFKSSLIPHHTGEVPSPSSLITFGQLH
ncbi:hypothetical protein, partial [Cytobacillus praedii]|uniref:hypothetical protein n=1 Tax=Cytobacillus praedii TaxID=1742358 RepID=UPI001E32365B